MNDALTRVLDTAAALERAVDKRLAPLGLTSVNWRVLTAIRRAEIVGGGLMQPTALAALVIQEVHSLSGMLNRFEARGLVRKIRIDGDGRGVYLELTAEGRDVTEQAGNIAAALEADFATMIQSHAYRGLRALELAAFDLSNAVAPLPAEKRAYALSLMGVAE